MRNCVIHDKKSKYFFSETSEQILTKMTDPSQIQLL